MFTAANLILGCSMVASGLFGWWFLPVVVTAGVVGDWLARDTDEE